MFRTNPPALNAPAPNAHMLARTTPRRCWDIADQHLRLTVLERRVARAGETSFRTTTPDHLLEDRLDERIDAWLEFRSAHGPADLMGEPR